MDTTKISDDINHHRRRFLGHRALTVAAAQLRLIGLGRRAIRQAEAGGSARIKPGTNTSFASLKQIEAGVLNVGYAEAGPADGPAGHSSARLAL